MDGTLDIFRTEGVAFARGKGFLKLDWLTFVLEARQLVSNIVCGVCVELCLLSSLGGWVGERTHMECCMLFYCRCYEGHW